ncbi:MAG: Fe-S-containing hydro-lyase [Dethiobacteria bacterium]|jgi:fumarate hydratase subunit beta
MAEKRISAPLTDEQIMELRAGDNLLISGVIYTGRDAAHKRLVELIEKGEKLPIDLKGQIIYYVGPAPAKPGKVIGSAGPTTSVRMDAYTPAVLKEGLKVCIGKGGRSKEVKEALQKYKAVYVAAVGGAAALIAKKIKKAEVVAYEDLGPEAIRRLEVEDFPVTVINDAYGNDLYEEGAKRYRIE